MTIPIRRAALPKTALALERGVISFGPLFNYGYSRASTTYPFVLNEAVAGHHFYYHAKAAWETLNNENKTE